MVAVRCHNKMACSTAAIIRIFVPQSLLHNKLLAAWDRIRFLVVPMVETFGTCDNEICDRVGIRIKILEYLTTTYTIINRSKLLRHNSTISILNILGHFLGKVKCNRILSAM